MSGYQGTRERLLQRLGERAPGRVQLLTGPRQVGKTTLLLEVERQWGGQALYAAADAPEAALPGWFELQWQRAVRLAEAAPAVLLLDEVQYLTDWSRLLKAEVDKVWRMSAPLHVVVSGSAALRLGAGTRETMAGRFERLTLTHWSARDLAAAFHLSAEDSTRWVVQLGAFPGAMAFRHDFHRWRAYVRDAIIDPALGRDLMALEAVRKPALLRQVFAVCSDHAAEIVALSKIGGLLSDSSLATVSHYLELLGEAFLVTTLSKYAHNEVRRRSSPPKLVPLSNAFVTATLPQAPTPTVDPQRWGRLVENACLAYLVNAGHSVRYWRQEPHEVDAVVDDRWAIEFTTSWEGARDLAGLLAFTRQFPACQPLVVCDARDLRQVRHAGVDAIPWTSFLWDGLPGP